MPAHTDLIENATAQTYCLITWFSDGDGDMFSYTASSVGSTPSASSLQRGKRPSP